MFFSISDPPLASESSGIGVRGGESDSLLLDAASSAAAGAVPSSGDDAGTGLSSSETTALVMVNPAWPLVAAGRRNRAVVAVSSGNNGQPGSD